MVTAEKYGWRVVHESGLTGSLWGEKNSVATVTGVWHRGRSLRFSLSFHGRIWLWGATGYRGEVVWWLGVGAAMGGTRGGGGGPDEIGDGDQKWWGVKSKLRDTKIDNSVP